MLFNATQAEELRVAVVDGQELIDLDIETVGKEQRKGNIYNGIITRVEPSLEACFVDYGTDRHGFLPFKEISRTYFKDYNGGRPRIQDVIHEGTKVLVQVEKDERGNKGAALTTFISLAGRYLVLMPNNPRGGGVSRRIEGDERQELKETMRQLPVPKGMSLIARTAGIGRSLEDLEWDLNYQLQVWEAIKTVSEKEPTPSFLHKESSLIVRALRDYFQPDIGEILIDNEEIFQDASQYVSHVMRPHVNKVKFYNDHTPLFSRYQIEQQFESAFSRSVTLPSGGAIVIDHTEALVSVDVNSARSTRGADIEETAFRTNLEAAEEIARQLRLRDLGGLVVIDFIDMENPKNQKELEQTLRNALRYDRARIQMDKLSRFGLLELSRQRLRASLGETSYNTCPRCFGTGVIRGVESSALHILRVVQEEAMKENTGEIHAQVPVDVASFLLNEKRTELFAIGKQLDVTINLIPNIHLETPNYKVTRIREDDMDENAQPSYKLVEKPEEEDILEKVAQQRKAAQQVPAIKRIAITQPAPEEKKVSLFGMISNWFKATFASEAPEPEKKPVRNNRHPQNNNNKSNNQRRNNQRKNTQNENKRNENNNRPNKDQSEKEVNSNNSNTQQQKQDKQQRTNNRNNKANQEQKANKEAKVIDNSKEAVKETATENTSVETKNNAQQSNNANRRRRNNRRDRKIADRPEHKENRTKNQSQESNSNHKDSSNTGFITNEEQINLEQQAMALSKKNEVDIVQSVRYVHQAIAKVLGVSIAAPTTPSQEKEAPVVTQEAVLESAVVQPQTMEINEANAAEPELLIQTEEISTSSEKADDNIVAEKETLSTEQTPPVIQESVPFDPSAIDLGHLIMVQTKEGYTYEETIVECKPRLRRSDRPVTIEEEIEPIALQQVETKK